MPARWLDLVPHAFGPCYAFHLDVEVALAACFDLHGVDWHLLGMDHVRLAVDVHLLLYRDVEQVMGRIDMVVVPDFLLYPKIFFSHHEVSVAQANLASDRTVDVEEFVPYSALAQVYGHSDIAYVEYGIVFALVFVVEVHYEVACLQVAFVPATGPVIEVSVAAVASDTTMEHFVEVEVLAWAVVR